MATEIDLHPVQAYILRTLLFTSDARFSELNTTKISNDHFTFHINQLVELDLIIKNDNKKYQLTQQGKEFANRMDTDNAKVEKQAKVAVLLVVVRKNQKKTEYLIQKRLKQPFYGFYGSITGKVKWGESLQTAAEREFMEETGLHGRAIAKGVVHVTEYSTEKNLLEDKFFFIHSVDNLSGKLIENFEGGMNSWKTEAEIKKLSNVFPLLTTTIEVAESSTFTFLEKAYFYEKKFY